MKNLENNNIDRARVYNGHLTINTASCGCCSEYYDTDPEAFTPDFSITQDELVKYIEREEQRIEALKDDLADGGQLSREEDE